MFARVLGPVKCHEHTRYRIDIGHSAATLKWPICEKHRLLIRKHLGEKVRLNGIKAVMRGENDSFASRSLGYGLTSLVLFEWANHACQTCQQPLDFAARSTWEIDHIVPICLGGVNTFSNIQILCPSCHETKSRPERGLANKHRFDAMRNKRWFTRHQKDELIAKLQTDNTRLKSLLARYIEEEEGVG
jgi:5-methylcytosine-specific restriction endonuclease McrA